MKRLIALLLVISSIGTFARTSLPVTGTWVNLFYQDVRNKYSNPPHLDNSDCNLWRAKVDQMHRTGIEYIVFMAVANEGLSAYPSAIMGHSYAEGKESPVSAIMDRAAEHGMKVFLSIGWAENQDDNLKRPEILNRQLQIMEELASIYGNHPALYGWYLPVEDCLGPVLPESSVKAVNRLVAKAHRLTPGKKTMISPYGFFCSKFDDEKFGERIAQLNVDIIAYQDEVGCVREKYPLPRLRENWRKIKQIHDRTDIELWANCELFTWEKDLNSRTSALIPAAPARVVAQLQAATQGGVQRIISFMTCGILDDNADSYPLGQPQHAAALATEYDKWRNGDEAYGLLEDALNSSLVNRAYCATDPLFDGIYAQENPNDKAWQRLDKGLNEYFVNTADAQRIYLRFLDCKKDGYEMPYKVGLSLPDAEGNYQLVRIYDVEHFANDLHDTWIQPLVIKLPGECKTAKISILTDVPCAIDEITVL